VIGRVLTSLALWLLPVVGVGQTIYIFEDDEGITHFTDRKPVTDHEVRVQRAVAEPKNLIEMHRSGPDSAPVWWFRNRIYGPVALSIRFSEARNVVSEPPLPALFVLEARVERELVTIGPLDRTRSWEYRIETAGIPGHPEARHRPERPYRAPVPAGRRFRIGQAFGGAYSHTTTSSHHAVDIDMPTGTPVHAARAGLVMDMARHFHGTGEDPRRYGPRANFVRILHEDGSMAVYAHLGYEGVIVRLGDRVERGQQIGVSGNTGYSTGPHLHFVVQVNRAMELVSVPFEFEGENGQSVAPEPGMFLQVH